MGKSGTKKLPRFIQNSVISEITDTMPSVTKGVCYVLSLVSFHFVCGKLYSTSHEKTCKAKNDACLEVNQFADTEEIDGPTIIGRDGLTRLEGIGVMHFNSYYPGFPNIYRASCTLSPNLCLLV